MTYDGLLLTGVLCVATLPLLSLTGGEAISSGNPLYPAYLLGISWLYFTAQWTRGGQTLGMRAWRIRLIANGGGGAGWGPCSTRFAAALLCWLPAGLGFLSGIGRADGLPWHDRLSGTRLIVDPSPAG